MRYRDRVGPRSLSVELVDRGCGMRFEFCSVLDWSILARSVCSFRGSVDIVVVNIWYSIGVFGLGRGVLVDECFL